MKIKSLPVAQTVPALVCELGLLAIGLVLPAAAMAGSSGHARGDEKVEHVLLISVDGLHQSDLVWYVRTHTLGPHWQV